jgi:hypothetical protein
MTYDYRLNMVLINLERCATLIIIPCLTTASNFESCSDNFSFAFLYGFTTQFCISQFCISVHVQVSSVRFVFTVYKEHAAQWINYMYNCLPDLKFSVKTNNDVKYMKYFGFINNPHVVSIVSANKDKLFSHIICTWHNGCSQMAIWHESKWSTRRWFLFTDAQPMNCYYNIQYANRSSSIALPLAIFAFAV